MKMSRIVIPATLFSLMLFSAGCGSNVPAEATGEPVPADYADQQAAAQKAAQEAAMNAQ